MIFMIYVITGIASLINAVRFRLCEKPPFPVAKKMPPHGGIPN
jgi:hypothetical protein